MLTLIADSNITHLHDYFNAEHLSMPVNIITMAGRDIQADVLAEYQPDALLIRSVTNINETLLADNDSVQFIGSATIGTDHVDQDYLSKRGIRFTNAAGSSKHSVAQYVITAILTLRPQYWQIDSHFSDVPKIGIVGLGNIGGTLANYVQDLGWQVLGYDPFLPKSDINNASFETVLTQSDVISLHVPLTFSENSQYPTHHLIDANALRQMPIDTLLINSARGRVISESALLNDLEINNLKNSQRQVVLDVFEHEPVVSAKLLNHLSLATPHIAGYTLEGKLRGTQMIFDAFVKVFADTINVNAINTDAINIKQSQLMNDLLPANSYDWQTLKDNPDLLTEFYDIKADDLDLRKSMNSDLQQVPASAFDALRKNYNLRREWQHV